MKIPIRAWLRIAVALQAIPFCRLAGQAPLNAADSVAVVRAFWRLATSQVPTRGVVWFWTPERADSESVAFSPTIRATLVRHEIPASERRPVGDDTVVFRLVEWHVDKGSVRLRMSSDESTILGTGAHRCRTRSGNSGSVQVRRARGEWVANWEGPGIHGTQVCRPIS